MLAPVAPDPFAVFVIVTNYPYTLLAAGKLIFDCYTGIFDSVVDFGSGYLDSLAGFNSSVFDCLTGLFGCLFDSFSGLFGSCLNCLGYLLAGFLQAVTNFGEKAWFMLAARVIITLA
jgi:hypothetical protein